MRKSAKSNGLMVNVIAGSYRVMFGLDLTKTICNGFLGFSIHRLDQTENESYYMKAFQNNDPRNPAASQYPPLARIPMGRLFHEIWLYLYLHRYRLGLLYKI
ncbi:MAG: hypothetical protein KF803_02770 [Cyclobacteriaceae bacterium]|nr:hypothetical protein [Cyclobacteriaceae bacterium]